MALLAFHYELYVARGNTNSLHCHKHWARTFHYPFYFRLVRENNGDVTTTYGRFVTVRQAGGKLASLFLFLSMVA